MLEYPLSFKKIKASDAFFGVINLGFGLSLNALIKIAGIDVPSAVFDWSISGKEEREKMREKGRQAKKRLREILRHGASQPHGLILSPLHPDDPVGGGVVIGEVKYVYAQDLCNYQAGQKPWTGWKSVGAQLVSEELATWSVE